MPPADLSSAAWRAALHLITHHPGARWSGIKLDAAWIAAVVEAAVKGQANLPRHSRG
jgi:hypothetical protein